MVRIKDYFKAGAVLIAIFMVTGLFAQDIDEAKSLAKEGKAALDQKQYEVAVMKFEACIDICEEILVEFEEDEEAEELLDNLNKTMPTVYLNAGLELANSGSLNEALGMLEKCDRIAKKMNAGEVLKNSAALAAKIYLYNAGNDYKKATNTDQTSEEGKQKYQDLLSQSLGNVDQALERDPNNLEAYKLKVGILIKQEADSLLIETTRTVQGMPSKVDQRAIIAMTANYFFNKGLVEKQSAVYDDAIENLTTSLEFDNKNADAYYLLAFIYNIEKEWDKAIEVGNAGLAVEKPDQQARLYYELGTAYFGVGDTEAACEAYAQAEIGLYLEQAQKMRKSLECK